MMRGTLGAVGGLNTLRNRFKVVCPVSSFICSVFLVHLLCVGGDSLSSDGEHLLALKRSLTCDSSKVLSDWNENDPHPCAWSGVTCDPVSLRVVALRIVGSRPGQNRTESASRGRVLLDDVDRVPCGLVGTLSPAIGRLSELRLLSVTFNSISGELPKSIADLKLLQTLDLRSNLLTGRLPSELGELPNLQVLNLDNNGFQGRIPVELSSCRKLRRLSIAGNVLSGSIPPSLGSLLRLASLSLSGNKLFGSIPIELAGGGCALRRLDLSGNRLSGDIPAELGDCSQLRLLVLNFNDLVGSIPVSLGRLTGLKSLQVAGNFLSGSIPPHISNCSKLEFLVLMAHRSWSSYVNRSEGNHFGGTLPPDLTLLPNLRVLWAPGAGFTGRLPTDWGPCVKLESLNLAENALSGEVSSDLSNCRRLVFLDLNSNKLSGVVPQQQRAPCTRVFNLSGNVALERIPEVSVECEKSVPCRKFLDFGGTFFVWGNLRRPVGFQGSLMGIDKGFWKDRLVSGGESRATSVLDQILGSNFSGEAPLSSGERRMLTDEPDYGESYSVAVPNSGPSPNKKLSSILVAAITAGCAILIVLVVLGLMFRCSRQRSQRGPPPQAGRKVVVTFMHANYQLTYENVVRATGNFCIDNLIGSGGFGATYKAEVKPGFLVAVKRLAIGRFQGVQQFDTEIRTLGRIRHPNLVTLIGYHASEEEMFLIYNFFSQGNLETLIHMQKEEMVWKTRHSIALRIAEALAFLHDECVPRVLHRDIKPSNILLDDNLNAHLSDFGLARLLGASETHATTDVAGTFGYVAPEYAMTCRVTDKADVYSYGVVLLELLSGKRALDPSFCEYGDGFNIVSWACLLIRQERAREVFTARLWELGPEKNLLETLKLAVLCTVDQLSIRPTMREVVDTLVKLRPMVTAA